MPTLAIVPIREVPFAEWLEMWLDYVRPQITDRTLPLHALTYERLCDGETSGLFGVAAVSSGAVGFAHYVFHASTWEAADFCHLQDLYVAPSARGQRVGETLIRDVAEHARRRGSSAMGWRTQESNVSAHALYSRLARRTNRVSYHLPLTGDPDLSSPAMNPDRSPPDPARDLAAVNAKIVAPGETLPAVRLKDGSTVQTGTVATMLHNISLYNAGQRGTVERELELAIPTLFKVGLFDLFAPREWARGRNPGRAFVGRLADDFLQAKATRMPIDPTVLAALASDYAKPMTSIRGRRVQRLLRREFAGADRVLTVRLASGRPAVLGVSASGAALCATDGTGPHASVIKWLHGSAQATEARFDLLKDSLPLLSTHSVALPAEFADAAQAARAA